MVVNSLSIVCLIVLFTGACASNPSAQPVWNPENDAIQVRFKPDVHLHSDDGGAHTLMVCLYQLNTPNTFKRLSGDINGIYELLECGAYDSQEVAATERIIVRPGREALHTLDRAEGAKYLAVVAGYSNLKKERMTRLYDIPIEVEKKGLIRRTKVLKPGKLVVNIELGPSQIR